MIMATFIIALHDCNWMSALKHVLGDSIIDRALV